MTTEQRGENAFLSTLSTPEKNILLPDLVDFELRLGDRVEEAGARVENVVFPHSGLIGVSIPDRFEAGAGGLLVGRDNLLGTLSASGSAPTLTNAEVFIRGRASRMSAAAFRHALDRSDELRRLAARFAGVLMAQAQQGAHCHATHPVEARVCRWLLEVEARSGSKNIPLTQSTLARMLGVRRTTVTLIAGRLEADGIVSCRRGYIEIVRQDELEARCCGCYAALRAYGASVFAGHGEGTGSAAPERSVAEMA